MKTILTTITICMYTLAYSQDTSGISKWGLANRYRLTTYAFSLLDNADSQFKAGSEFQLEILSYKWKRHEFAIATGLFFINVKSSYKNPSMQYFYFPIDLNYRLYSKSKKIYGEFSIGTSLVMYEDSKIFEYNKFWLAYEDAIEAPYNIIRKNIWGIHSLKFGYCIGKHVSLNIGEMSYAFSTTEKKFKNITRLAFGVDFKL